MSTSGCEIRFSGENLCLRAPFSNENVQRCRSVPGARWKPDWKCWVYPMGVSTVKRLVEAFGPAILSADPSGRVANVAASIEAGRAARAARECDLPDVPNLKRTAWKHQKAAYAFARQMPGVLLNMGMGTGKSLTTIGIIMERGQFNLILCPKAVVSVWPMEFGKHYAGEVILSALPGDPPVKKRVLDAENAVRRGALSGKPVVVVCNYESAWRDPFSGFALGGSWGNLVMDEIHKIKAPQGKASRFCEKLAAKVPHRLGLTGTPLPHSPLDAFGIFRAIDASVFGRSFTRFRSRYAVMGGYLNHQVVGYQRQDEFQQLFDSITFTAGRDVIELPPEQHIKLSCALSPRARRIYAELEDDLYAEIGGGEVTAANALVKLLRLAQITSGHIKTDDGRAAELCELHPGEPNAKAALMADTLDDLAVREPVVVFARFTKDLDIVRRIAEGQGRRYCELSGRANELDLFKRGGADVIGVNIQSGGVGVDLTRACYAFYYSCGYSLGDFMQSQARISRPGQTRPVVFYYFVAEKTVDEKIYDAMQKKHDVVESILRPGEESGRNRFSFAGNYSK